MSLCSTCRDYIQFGILLSRMPNTHDLYRLVRLTCPSYESYNEFTRRKKHTSRTGRVIYSRVVVDPCIHYQSRKYWKALASHYTCGSSQGRVVRVVVDTEEWLNISLSTKKVLETSGEIHTEECGVFLVLLRTTREMCAEEWVFLILNNTWNEFTDRQRLVNALHVRLVRVDNSYLGALSSSVCWKNSNCH